MSFTITETPTSQSHVMLKAGDMSTFTRTYLVEGSDTDTTSQLAAYWKYTLNRCPKVYQPDFSVPIVSFVLASVEILPVPEAVRKWMVRETYTTRDGCGCVAKVSRSAGVRLVDRFKVGTIPASTTVGAFPPSASDAVSGTSIDMRGAPQKFAVVTQNIVIETVIQASYFKATTGNPWPNYQSIASTYQFKRNNASFLGWNAGQVVFMGMDESPLDDIWRMCSWRFIADTWYHLEQRAAPEANGKVLVADTSTWPDGTEMMHASKINWYQPYPSTASLIDMFSQCVQSELLNPSPNWVSQE